MAPDVTIMLPAPERRGGAASEEVRLTPCSRIPRAGVRPTSSHALIRQLTDLRDTERQLRAQLERLEADRAQAMERLARRLSRAA